MKASSLGLADTVTSKFVKKYVLNINEIASADSNYRIQVLATWQ